MAILLRDYQDGLVTGARAALRRVRRVLVQAPTGAGKTVIAGYMIEGAARRGFTCWFNCHRVELVEQTSWTFRQFGIEHGVVAPGYDFDPSAQVQVCSIDTLRHRAALLPPPRLVVWDEAHHMAAATWAALQAALSEAWHVGLSATPWRLNGEGLRDYFEELIPGPQIAELIRQGALSPFRVFAPPPPDGLGRVRKVAGEFAVGAAAQVMGDAKIIGDVVTHWQARAAGLRTVGFACNVEHSRAMVAAFRERGIPAAHLDGNTPARERRQIIRDYADGALAVLWNVALFGEGFDLAAHAGKPVTIDAVIQARPTQSLALHLQQQGRALRPAPGKVAVILDHAGNTYRHGLPDDEREWSLDGRPKTPRAANDNAPPPPVTCSGCWHQIRRPLPRACPHCGHPLEAADPRPIKAADGHLVEIGEAERRRIRQMRAREQAEAQTLQELVALGQRRGMKNPQGWAWRVWSARAARRAS